MRGKRKGEGRRRIVRLSTNTYGKERKKREKEEN
jgi:hypothetical protein